MMNLTYEDTTRNKTIYFADDHVEYYHTGRGEYVTGTIEFIDWDGSASQAIPDGIARAYVVGEGFADYVTAAQLRPAGTFSK